MYVHARISQDSCKSPASRHRAGLPSRWRVPEPPAGTDQAKRQLRDGDDVAGVPQEPDELAGRRCLVSDRVRLTVSAPIWMASPPEIHSALLSTGPGPGPLLAAAGAWNSLSAEYAELADELSAVVAAVQAAVWEGPGAESYAAAHAPYVAWLTQAAADATATAAQQEIAAGAYTAALAAMPTLGELATNHAVHAVLLATNFFGINTIPIALNEADYVRMWIQAAATMGIYQAISDAAVAESPQTTPAPQILKADGASSDPPSDSGQPGTLTYFLNQLIAYIEGNAPGQGNETLLQYITGVPPGTPLSSVLATDLSEDEAIVQALVGFAGNNPALLPLSYLASAAILIEHVSVQFLQFAYTFPGLTAGLATPLLALPAGFAGTAGIAGLAGLQSPAPPPTGVEAVPVAPTAPAASPAPTPVSAAPAAAAPAPPAPTASAPAAPVSASTPAVPPAPGAPPPPGAAPGPFPYRVGGTTAMESQASAQARAKKKALESDVAAAPAAAAAATREKERARRRRRANAEMLGRGYEYMDLDDQTGQGLSATTASDQGAGTLGFAGTTRQQAVAEATGLTTLTGDAFGGGPRAPMMPSTWAPGHSGKPTKDIVE